MRTHTHFFSGNLLRGVVFSVLIVSASFALGVKSAGELQPFDLSQAADESTTKSAMRGDITGDGLLDLQDVIRILTLAEGLDIPTREELVRGDADGDLRLTGRDALWVIHSL